MTDYLEMGSTLFAKKRARLWNSIPGHPADVMDELNVIRFYSTDVMQSYEDPAQRAVLIEAARVAQAQIPYADCWAEQRGDDWLLDAMVIQ